MATSDKKPLPPKLATDEVELHPDAWERFEATARQVMKSKRNEASATAPKRRKAKVA